MAVKRILLVVLTVGVVLLAMGSGPGRTSTIQGWPQSSAADGGDSAIPYAGTLADPAEQPVADGRYDFSFVLYAAESGGEPLWSEVQKGVAVRSGQFATNLGRATPIPVSVTSGSGVWLAVGVRGPGETAFTALNPRQRLSTALPAAPASATANGACPHDHLGEIWGGWTGPGDGLWLKGNVGWSSGMFLVDNNGNGPAIWGYNNGGGNAVRGDAEGPGSLGVYGSSEQAAGVVGSSSNANGVEGYTTSAGQYGVYGEGPGIGVYGHSTGAGWGVYSQGDMRVTTNLSVWGTSDLWGYVTFHGGKSGYVVEIAQNDDIVSLEVGDVVVISGAGPAVVGEIPVVKVRRATAGKTGAVIGIVDKHYVPAPPISAPGAKAESIIEDAAIAPGEYLTVVTLGAYKAIKVDATYAPITPGDLLVASPNPGHAMRAVSPQPGTIIGKALESLDSGTGVMPVIVTLQ
jgi:hypothetical protein